MKLLLSLFLLLCSVTASAIDIRGCWATLPDSIVNDRSKINIDSLLTEAKSYVSFQKSSTLDVQIKLLNSSDGKDVICLVKTYSGPARNSEVFIYDSEWNLISRPSFSLADVIGTANNADCQQYFEPLFIEVRFNEASDDAQLTVGQPALSDEEKRKIEHLLLQKTVKWNGVKFE